MFDKIFLFKLRPTLFNPFTKNSFKTLKKFIIVTRRTFPYLVVEKIHIIFHTYFTPCIIKEDEL